MQATGYIEKFTDLREIDAGHKAEWDREIADKNSLRETIASGLEAAYQDADRADDLEDAKEVQRKVEERFGASAGDVLVHFQNLDGEMRRDPLNGLARVEQFFLRTGHAPVTTPKDLKPAAEREQQKKLAEMAKGDDLRAAIAKGFVDTIGQQEAATRLADAAKAVKGPVRQALQRILDVAETGARDPKLAAAQWFSTSVPSASELDAREQEMKAEKKALENGLDRLLEGEFSDLTPHVAEIAAAITAGKIKCSGDLRIDLKNARKLLKGK